MVIGIRVRDCWLHMRMCMVMDRHGLIDVQRVLVDHRHHAQHLCQHEDCQQRCVKAPDCPQEPHSDPVVTRSILDEAGMVDCGGNATVQNDVF